MTIQTDAALQQLMPAAPGAPGSPAAPPAGAPPPPLDQSAGVNALTETIGLAQGQVPWGYFADKLKSALSAYNPQTPIEALRLLPAAATPSLHGTAATGMTPPQSSAQIAPTIAQNVQGAANAIGAGLGDAAATGRDLRPGQGWLAGVEKTMAARGERLSREQHDKAQMAEANLRMRQTEALTHKINEEAITSSITNGTQMVQKMRSAASPAPVRAEDKTSDELGRMIKEGKLDPAKETAYPTGRRQVGENPDGTPNYRTTYTAMGVPPDIDLDPKKPEDKKILDRLNKYAPPTPDSKWGDGDVQHFTGATFNLISQHASDNETADRARQKVLEDNEIEDTKRGAAIEAIHAKPEILNALSHNDNDPIKARNALQATGQYPNINADMESYYGKDEWKQITESNQKKLDERIGIFKQEQTKVDAAHGEEAAGMASAYADKAANETDPQLKRQYQTWSNQLNKAASTSQQYDVDKKQRETAAQSAMDTGDLDTLRDMVRHYDVEPDQLFSKRFQDAKAKREFIASLGNDFTGTPWTEAKYKARWNTMQDFGDPTKKGGAAVQSLQTFTGHLSDANSLIEGLRNTDYKLANKTVNALKDQWGNDKIGAFDLALSAANHEYESFLLNQHAEHEIDKEAMTENTNHNSSPAKIQANLRQMAQTIAIRARSANNGYRKMMGENIPNLLDAGQQNALRQFGIDPAWITNTDEQNMGASTPAMYAERVKAQTQTRQGQPPSASPAGMVHMKKPDGTFMYVPKANQDAAIKLGATVVQ